MMYKKFAIGLLLAAPLIVMAVQSLLPAPRALTPVASEAVETIPVEVAPTMPVDQPAAVPVPPVAQAAIVPPGTGIAPTPINPAPLPGAGQPMNSEPPVPQAAAPVGP